MMRHASPPFFTHRRRVLAIGLAVVAVLCAASLVAVRRVARLRLERSPAAPTSAVLAADPMRRLRILSPIPTLLIVGDADDTVPPAGNAFPAAKVLGAQCHVIVVHGASHSDPRLVNTRAVDLFLETHGGTGLPVVLLHGWGADKSFWYDKSRHGAPSAVALRIALQQKHEILTASFGNTWGSDHAIAGLENLIGARPRIVIIGGSMGAALMWRYAEKHPERAAALVGIVPVCSFKAMCRTRLGSDLVRAYEPQSH